MTIPEASVALFTAALGVIGIGGFRAAVGTFGRKIAPYCLTATGCMIIALVTGWLVLTIFATSALS